MIWSSPGQMSDCPDSTQYWASPRSILSACINFFATSRTYFTNTDVLMSMESTWNEDQLLCGNPLCINWNRFLEVSCHFRRHKSSHNMALWIFFTFTGFPVDVGTMHFVQWMAPFLWLRMTAHVLKPGWIHFSCLGIMIFSDQAGTRSSYLSYTE